MIFQLNFAHNELKILGLGSENFLFAYKNVFIGFTYIFMPGIFPVKFVKSAHLLKNTVKLSGAYTTS